MERAGLARVLLMHKLAYSLHFFHSWVVRVVNVPHEWEEPMEYAYGICQSTMP